MKTKVSSLSKSKHLILCLLILIIFLPSCATTVSNIKSVDDLKGRKLLVGRFIFYVNGKLIEPHERVKHRYDKGKKTKTEEDKELIVGFTIFLQNGETKKIVIGENGYVYIPVYEGHYYIKRIKHHSILGTYSFSTLPNTGINVKVSDEIVSFGTIKVEFRRSAESTMAGILTLLASQGLIAVAPAQLRVTQDLDWDSPRNYISSKFSIPPELIRDETIKFSKKLEEPFK